jgi:UDP-2,4-diacetamido-2,4,6-trideoxy-beta-L-altropyranose hydrolase
MNPGCLLIRADASVAIGTGHVMRCLALAQAWQDVGGRSVFAMAESTDAICSRLAAESCDVAQIPAAAGGPDDSRETLRLARTHKAEWVVIDGYHFDAEYQRLLKDAGLNLLVLDDYGHARYYSADLILNQNLGADESLYVSRDSKTHLLLGPRYCLLRREFSAWRSWRREVASVGRRLLVTMGGSDPANVTAKVIEGLKLIEVDELEVIVVAGGSNPHSGSLSLPGPAGKRMSLRRDVKNIPELMAWADAAVSSAGTTCWELCLLAVPSLLIDVADNQTAPARELARRGCAIHLGNGGEVSAEQIADEGEKLLKSERTRRDLSLRCRELVDGLGARRVVLAMRSGLRLRSAREDDCRLLWDWVNDPQVRAAAFCSDPIPWERHKTWFASKMKDPNCHILIAQDSEGRTVGQFRVDWRSDREGDIDVSVAPACRGTGNGSVLIDLGTNWVFAERGERLHAFVKVENHASRRAFEQAGFANLGEESVHGCRAIHYIRSAESNSKG